MCESLSPTATAARWALRLTMIAVAALIAIGAVYWSVSALGFLSAQHLRLGFLGYRAYRRRPLEPMFGQFPGFFGEFVVIGAISVTGRLILRLRL